MHLPDPSSNGTTGEVKAKSEDLDQKPKILLTNNGNQFKIRWKRWCKLKGIKPLFAHPSPPQLL